MAAQRFEFVPRGCETVLLVAPEPDVRKLAAFMLGKQGYEVLEARGMSEALALLETRADTIDLVLVDASSRGVNGRDVTERVLAVKPGCRVLCMCYAEHKAARSMASQMRLPVLEKPFTMGVLAGKVRQVLDTPLARAAGF